MSSSGSFSLLVTDLDGTAMLSASEGRPSSRVRTAVADAHLSGLTVAAATGRPWANAHPILADLSLTAPCVLSGGTRVVDPVSGEVLWSENLSFEALDVMLAACAPYRYELLVAEELVGEGSYASERSVHELWAAETNCAYVMGASSADAEAMAMVLRDCPDLSISLVESWSRHGVDVHITPVSATKEQAVAVVLDLLGVSAHETVGVGDGSNDIHLFAAVGLKVAMGNASLSLKALADAVVPSVVDDGLAQLVELLSSDRSAARLLHLFGV